MQLMSSAFQALAPIPTVYSCEGRNISPQLSWDDAPLAAKSLAIILHDPDAPRQDGFTHWVLYNIPPGLRSIAENCPQQKRLEGAGMQGKNDSGKIGYMGPCPPSGKHRYFFRLYALDRELEVEPGSPAEEIQAAMEGHIISQTELMGTYAKASEQAA